MSILDELKKEYNQTFPGQPAIKPKKPEYQETPRKFLGIQFGTEKVEVKKSPLEELKADYDVIFKPKEKKIPMLGEIMEYPGWQALEREGKMTPTLQALKEAGFAPPRALEFEVSGLPKAELRAAPPEIPEKDTFFKKIARFILPKSLELKFKLRKPTKAEEIWEWGEAINEYYGRGEDIIGGIKTFGQGLTMLPKATAVAVLQATQGHEGASVVDKDWADRYIETAKTDLDRFVMETAEKYKNKILVSGIPLKVTDMAEFPQNLAFSLTSMGAGLGVGVPIGLIPLPGARAAAWTLGTAASGKVAYEMTAYQIMQEYLELKDTEKKSKTGEGLTLEEEKQLKEEFSYEAMKYGLWEAIPEAISNLAFVKILTVPLLKMGISKTMVGSILTKITGMYGEELLTETITQKGQSAIEVEAGLREGRITWIEAFKEVAPQTFLLTTIMTGAGSTVIQTSKGINKITNSLKNEIGVEHPLYKELSENIEKSIKAEEIEPKIEVEKPKVEVPKAEVPTIEIGTKFIHEKGGSATITSYLGKGIYEAEIITIEGEKRVEKLSEKEISRYFKPEITPAIPKEIVMGERTPISQELATTPTGEKKVVLSPNLADTVNKHLDKVPDVDNPTEINYWADLPNGKRLYIEGWSDKCLVGTGFPKMEEGGTVEKLDYIEDLTPDILKDKAKERGLVLIKGGFIEKPDATSLYGVTYGIYAPAVKGVKEVKPEVRPEVDMLEVEGWKEGQIAKIPKYLWDNFVKATSEKEKIEANKALTKAAGFEVFGVTKAERIRRKEVEPEVPVKPTRIPREKPVVQTKISIIDEGKRAEEQAEILFQLEIAQKGERIHWEGYDGTPHTIGVDSSFPKWVPDKLRSRKLFDSVLKHIKNDTLPKKADEVSLYNIVAEQLGLKEAINVISQEEEIDVSKLFEDEKINDQISKISPTKEGKVAETIARGVEKEALGLAAKKWGVKMAAEPEIAKTINKTEIMTWAEKTFKVPLKMKATYKWRQAGVYYPQSQIVRMEKWGELSVLAHEISHHIDRILRKTLGRNWYRPNRVIVKELADLDYDQKQRRTEEGFAEYMRYRLTTNLANEKAPNFHKYFNQFLENNPDLKSKLDGLKERFDIWHKQGAENRIIQHIDWKREHIEIKGIQPKLKKALKFINEKFNDEFYVPQTIVREIEKVIGRKLPPTRNPAIMMEYFKSKSGAIARTFVMDSAIDEYGNVVGPGLKEILKPISNKEMKQFIAYAVSKRALNLASRDIESGFDVDDARFVIEKYKDKGWDETANNLTKWANHSLDWVIRAGGLDAKAAKLMRDLNPVYLTFKRAFIDEVGVISKVGGYVDTGGVVKRIKGSGRPIINPIEGMIAQLRELISKSEKISIANLFADLAEEEGVGGFITEVPAPIRPTTFPAGQIKNYIQEITGEEITELNDFLTVFTQDFRYGGKENIVSLWRNGKQKFYEIHPDLYESFKGIDPLKLGPLGKIFAPFSRMLRLGATGLKVSFGLVRNPFRDAFSYVVFSKRNKVTIFDPIKGYYKDIATKPGEITWRFKKLGGGLSGQIGLDRAATQHTYDELLMEKLGKKGKVLKVVKHPINTMRDILSVTEMGPRSVEVEAAYKKYTSEKWQKEHPDWTEEDAFTQAFIDAQDVTINFTKSGKWAKQINNITAFFNVAIRGPEKVYRSFRERPIQTFVKGILWLTLLAIGSWYRNKDKDWYKNLPSSYKYNNLFFEIGNKVFRLPIPFELGIVFMSAPQAMLDTFKDKDIKWLKGLLDLAKSQIPDPTPSAFQPVIDVASNKNWMGIPIESEGMQYLYPTERKRNYTSKFAIGLSQGLDKIGIQLSPIQIDYLMDSYSGGFLRQFRISGSETYDLPILGDIMLREPDYPKRQLNEYFADYEVLKQKKLAGIATSEEKKRLAKIDGFYNYYKNIQERIKIAKEKEDKELLKRYCNLLREKLKKYGYD